MDFLKERRNLLVIASLIIVLPLIIALAVRYGTPTKKEAPAPPPTASPGYLCPTTKEFCQNGRDVVRDSYLGFGIQAAINHPVYAIFDGAVTVSQTILPKDLGGETLQTIYIDNGEKNLRAVYLYKGQSFAPDQVEKGVIIGKIEGEIKAYQTWLIFQLIKGDPVKGGLLKLSPQDFK